MAAAGLPLGFGVLVTRPVKQAEQLCQLIEAQAGRAIRLPLLEIETVAVDSAGPLRLKKNHEADWLVFISANAVRCAFELLGPQWLAENKAKIAAIGQATTDALLENGITVDLKPKRQSNSEALLAELDWAGVSGLRFLIVRGEGGRELIADALRERGAIVEYAEVYRRVFLPVDRQVLLALLNKGEIGAVTVTSGEMLDYLVRSLGRDGQDLLMNTPLVVIGERLAAQAKASGFSTIIAAEADDKSIVDALVCLAENLSKSNQLRG
jgi:uroporphyrinogen-III synthase